MYNFETPAPHISGAVLCFLPGWQDIRQVQEKLEAKPHFSYGSQMILPRKEQNCKDLQSWSRKISLPRYGFFIVSAFFFLLVHSSLSVADQQAVFQRPQVGQRKIVLTTNIAETSITIDDVVHVVDTGTHKEQNYDPRTKASVYI